MDAFGKQQNGCQLDVHPLMCCGGNKELTYEYRMKLGSISFAIYESLFSGGENRGYIAVFFRIDFHADFLVSAFGECKLKKVHILQLLKIVSHYFRPCFWIAQTA